MAQRATSGLPEARKGIVPTRTVAAAVVACVVAFSAFFWAHSVMSAQAITFNGMRPPYEGYTSARDILTGVNSSQDWEAVAYSTVSKGGAQVQLHKVEDVRARSYLRVVIHVHDKDGVPLRRQQVIISWRARGLRTVESAITNDRGDASVLHWIPAADKGETVVVSAWTNTFDWSNGTYAWFVPR
jgi:hypothetical protein